MDSNYIRSLCVSVDFYEATFKHFPILRERSDYQKFFWHKPYIERCRMLARLDLGEFNDILDAELAGHFYGYRPVYLDGSRHTAAKARKARAAEKGIANSRPGFGSEALFIQKYLNSLPRNLFLRISSPIIKGRCDS